MRELGKILKALFCDALGAEAPVGDDGAPLEDLGLETRVRSLFASEVGVSQAIEVLEHFAELGAAAVARVRRGGEPGQPRPLVCWEKVFDQAVDNSVSELEVERHAEQAAKEAVARQLAGPAAPERAADPAPAPPVGTGGPLTRAQQRKKANQLRDAEDKARGAEKRAAIEKAGGQGLGAGASGMAAKQAAAGGGAAGSAAAGGAAAGSAAADGFGLTPGCVTSYCKGPASACSHFDRVMDEKCGKGLGPCAHVALKGECKPPVGGSCRRCTAAMAAQAAGKVLAVPAAGLVAAIKQAAEPKTAALIMMA